MSFIANLIRVLRKVLVNTLVSSRLFPRPLRPLALRLIGVDCGSAFIYSDLFIDGRDVTNVRIGAGSIINNQAYFDATDKVTIGTRVGMGSRCTILTASHVTGPHEMRCGDMTGAPVSIGAGVWMGAGTTVMPGVTIGDGAVIGAGSLVTADCEPDSIYVGRPARLLRRIEDEPADGTSVERLLGGQ